MEFSAFWFRRDLRLEDNTGLFHAVKKGLPIIPVFIFDKTILEKLSNSQDARVYFIYQQIIKLKRELQALGSDMLVLHGDIEECWKQIFQRHPIQGVFANRDYESYAIARDEKIAILCKSLNIAFNTYKDQVIFEKDELLKDDGSPYVVFTPFKNRFLNKINENRISASASYFLRPHSYDLRNMCFLTNPIKLMRLEDMGFQKSSSQFPDLTIDKSIIVNYKKDRDYPSVNGTSKLGIHLRFGTISIRQVATLADQLNQTFLNELIWRDFYSLILQAFPQVEFSSFKPQYDNMPWENDEMHFNAWCNGLTGYPMVDAGMRELNETGFMHNRLRMITASFLVKHLLIDWRWGEAYFAEKLLDFDLSSNNGGWQWAAGCGTDAAPYFRIFNPQTQQKRFDANFDYVKRWVPEYLSSSYPKQIIDHGFARERCLRVFKELLNKNN